MGPTIAIPQQRKIDAFEKGKLFIKRKELLCYETLFVYDKWMVILNLAALPSSTIAVHMYHFEFLIITSK